MPACNDPQIKVPCAVVVTRIQCDFVLTYHAEYKALGMLSVMTCNETCM